MKPNLDAVPAERRPGHLRHAQIMLALLCQLAAHVSSFAQGSLAPPGPPGPTMKTLDELDAKLESRIPISHLPFALTNSGSYYLTTNLTAPATNGLSVNASDVTIDLNGFTLRGGGGLAPIGIVVALGGYRNIAIRHGTLKNWGNAVQNGAGGVQLQLEDLQIMDNSGNGCLLGTNGVVKNCLFDGNSLDGLAAADNALVSGCVARGNGSSSSYAGINVGPGGSVLSCLANRNAGDGIVAGRGSAIKDCVANFNGFAGINNFEDCTILGCTVERNALRGIFGDRGCTVVGCTVNTNGGDGIWVHEGSTVKDCTVRTNAAIGINVAGPGCTVRGCTARGNGWDGINVPGSCLVLENNCSLNGNANSTTNAGIVVRGSANRIDGNLAAYNLPLGIRVIGTNNLIIRNSASSNSLNYAIVPSNSNALETTPGTDFQNSFPWSNFSF